MQNKPIIGVMPLWDEQKKSVWIHSGYIDGIIKAGGAPVLLPLTEDEEVFCRALEVCDGFLITGGQDVSPKLYGESAKSDNAISLRLSRSKSRWSGIWLCSEYAEGCSS